MNAASFGATFRAAWFDAWEALAYGWAFFRRHWLRLLWAYVPYFVLATIVGVVQSYNYTVGLRALSLAHDSATLSASFNRNMYLQFAASTLLLGILCPLYVYVANRVKNTDTAANGVAFLSSWRKYYVRFTILWIFLLIPVEILDLLEFAEARLMARGHGTLGPYLLSVLTGYFLLMPFVAPLLFIFVMEAKRILHVLKMEARMFVRNYAALVLLILIMHLCVASVRSIPGALSSTVYARLGHLVVAGPFEPASFFVQERKSFFERIGNGPGLIENSIQNTPAQAVAVPFFRARLLSDIKTAQLPEYERPEWQLANISDTTLDWLLVLAMFFIYVPAMFYWVKKRLAAETPAEAPEISPTATPDPNSPSTGAPPS